MGLLKNIFGGDRKKEKREGAGEPDSRYRETESSINHLGSENAPRRELVQVVLRDNMRRHGIPSDWIDCRILSVMTRKQKTGMHVQFIVKKGEDRLLSYIHPFQDSFWLELEKFDSRPHDWLFSLGWQFEGQAARPMTAIPGLIDGWDPADHQTEHDTQPSELDAPEVDTQPPESDPGEIESDLAQLYAIRDAALSQPADLVSLPPVPPGSGKGPPRR